MAIALQTTDRRTERQIFLWKSSTKHVSDIELKASFKRMCQEKFMESCQLQAELYHKKKAQTPENICEINFTGC